MNQIFSSKDLILGYSRGLQEVLASSDWSSVNLLAQDMLRCWQERRQVFFCGNGGSAGNAVHLANDFLYGIAKRTGGGLRVQALSANTAVMTCLANDVGYESIFSEQLAVQANAGDLLIALSGSGNSPNIVRVIEQAKGFTGGKCKELADVSIHFPVNDMQIAEDLQLIVGHMMMKWLYLNRPQ
jgi:D-sedoheptulose 7-phosphate isomerase